MFGTLERAMVPPLNRIRGQLGLAPVAGADDIFGRVPLLLYLTAEPFEYLRRDWPGNVVLVGPCDWDPPADPPGWLEQLDRPVVLVTTSSEFQDDHRLEVARRVEVAGAGTRLPARRLRPDRLRAKVHEAIRLREGARRIQQGFAAAGGSSAAADAFETRLLHRELPQKLPSRQDQASSAGS